MENHTVQELSEIEWHFWHVRKRSPLLIYLFFHGAASTAVKDFLYYIHTSGEIADHVVINKKELEEFRNKAWEKFKKGPEFVFRFMQEMYALNNKHMALWRILARKEFSTMTDNHLLEAYETYIEQLLAYAPAIYLPLALEPILSEECYTLLKQKASEKAQEWYDCIMTPIKESEVIEERKSLLRIAQKYGKKKNAKKISNDLKRHVERFSYLKRKDMFMEFFDEEYYLNKIQECKHPKKELSELEARTEKKKKQFQAILEKFKDNSFAQMLFITTNEAIYFRTWRTERHTQSCYYIFPLFKEIARRLDLHEYLDVLYILPPELRDIIKKNKLIDKQCIDQRKNAFTYITFGSKDALILQGEEALASLKYLKLSGEITDLIQGTPAFRGKVKGKVLVVTQRDQWLQIQHAEILVIHTTTPDMVPFLKNIKAIITEEGGILSHASVISREMKIPCIIGTKTTTKILKTGDYVEVDAEKGIVKKISEHHSNT